MIRSAEQVDCILQEIVVEVLVKEEQKVEVYFSGFNGLSLCDD